MSDRHNNNTSSHGLSASGVKKSCEAVVGVTNSTGLLGASSVSEAKADDEAFGTGLELSYGEYVHFSYKVGLYCKQRLLDQPNRLIKRSEVVSWYCRNYQRYLCKPDSLEYCKKIYKVAILNMLEDGLIIEEQAQPPHTVLASTTTPEHSSGGAAAVFVRTNSRFLLWAWTDIANAHEAQVDSMQMHRRGGDGTVINDHTTTTTKKLPRKKHSHSTIKTTTTSQQQQSNTTTTSNLPNTTTTVIVEDDSLTATQSKQQQQQDPKELQRLKQQQQQAAVSARVAGFRGISGIRAVVDGSGGGRAADSKQHEVIDE
eukprot:GHVS01042628.1.p1 GENE.GHVS01042628.1~~GHVS01042628.1.p1  ORF type:complete len:314 (-),score=92.44 GHVS01042628.1:203-1144(-)